MLAHEVIIELAPCTRLLTSIWIFARWVPREFGRLLLFHAEGGTTFRIGVACDKNMRHQSFIAWQGGAHVHVCRSRSPPMPGRSKRSEASVIINFRHSGRASSIIVWRQRLWDQIGDLNNGGFLAHRNPKESEDELEIIHSTCAGASGKAGQHHSNRILTKFIHPACAHGSSPLLHNMRPEERHKTVTGPHRNAELTQFRRQCRHTLRIDIIGKNLAAFLNKAPSDREPDT